MKKLTNKGFGKTEIIVGLCTLIVLLVIAMRVFANNNNNSNYSMLKKESEEFSYRVSIYKDLHPREDNTYYLSDLLAVKYSINLQNPFNKKEECDKYESFVVIKDGKKRTNLKCGNYLLESDYNEKYRIYELSEWKDKTLNGESRTFYNYSKNNIEMSNKYMLEKEFIEFYNENEDEEIYFIDDISSNEITILEKTMYREKKLVKEF